MGQVFTFSRNGWWNIVQVRMLHRPDQCFGFPSDSERIEQSGNSIEGHWNIYQACWLFFLAKFKVFCILHSRDFIRNPDQIS